MRARAGLKKLAEKGYITHRAKGLYRITGKGMAELEVEHLKKRGMGLLGQSEAGFTYKICYSTKEGAPEYIDLHARFRDKQFVDFFLGKAVKVHGLPVEEYNKRFPEHSLEIGSTYDELLGYSLQQALSFWICRPSGSEMIHMLQDMGVPGEALDMVYRMLRGDKQSS